MKIKKIEVALLFLGIVSFCVGILFDLTLTLKGVELFFYNGVYTSRTRGNLTGVITTGSGIFFVACVKSMVSNWKYMSLKRSLLIFFSAILCFVLFLMGCIDIYTYFSQA